MTAIKFPLKMADGADVRTLEELREHFDMKSVLSNYANGKLEKWLRSRYYYDEADAIAKLDPESPGIHKELCEILAAAYSEANVSSSPVVLGEIMKENLRLSKLKQYTADDTILNAVDWVAFDQDELDILLGKISDESRKSGEKVTVYLCGDKFSLPVDKGNVCYIGINNPFISIDPDKTFYHYIQAGITISNVRFDSAEIFRKPQGEEYYLKGEFEKAIPLIKDEAENGNPRAMYMLAMAYMHGTGIELNEEKCQEWLDKAKGLNEPLSMMNYAYWCCKDDNEKKMAILSKYSKRLKIMADMGDTISEFEYGDYLLNFTDSGMIGITYLTKVAEQGYVAAQNNLGNYYYHGKGVEQDYAKAAEWYRKAAEQGYAAAQDNIGYLYYHGKGVEQDYAKAAEWYRKAAEQGHASAQNNLGYCYDYG